MTRRAGGAGAGLGVGEFGGGSGTDIRVGRKNHRPEIHRGLVARADPADDVQTCLISTWKEVTRNSYGSHLRRIAFFHGSAPAGDTQSLAESILLLLFLSGYRPATLRGAVSALHAVLVMGWIPPLRWERLWRLARAPVATPGDRPYAGPHCLQVMAEACQTPEDWAVFAAAVLSFSSLTRVGEIASVRRSGLRGKAVAFWGLKRDSRWVSRDLGSFAGEWAHWLRRQFPGRDVMVDRAAVLEEGMARLLQGGPYAAYRWHSWRRAGAAFLRFRGLPWRYLCWWGRWASVRMAHFYAVAPEDFTFHSSSRLPWPTSQGVKWITTDTAEFWPSSLMGLCLPDERPAKLPATGSKRDRGSEAMVEGDNSGDAVQPPTAKRPSRPAPPRKPSRRTGQSTPSGPSVATSQSASTTERRTVPSSPARVSPPGGTTGEGVAPDSSTTAPAPESGSAVRAGGSPRRQSVAAKFKGRARDHQRTAPVVRGGSGGSGLLRMRSRGRGLGAPVELPPGTAMAGSRVRRLKGASRGQGSRQVPDPIIIDEG